MKITIYPYGDEHVIITNVKILGKNPDSTFNAVGDGWSSPNTPLTGLTDDSGNPLNPAEVCVRSKRDELLAACDYTQTLDYPATEAERNAWAVYRQSLRDVPAQEGFPNEVVWPTVPVRDKGGTILQALEPII
jgi:hypothetical protein